MRVIFAGTPDFARVALQALIDAGFDIPLVSTQPDRPAGRGMKLQASAVKQCAQSHGIPVAQPTGLRLNGAHAEAAQAAQQAIVDARADAMVVAAYGLILPQWVLDAPRLGCFNIHASLLPRWRGAAPIHRAIEAGDAQTGVTIMQMDAGLDTGDMLLVEPLSIQSEDTTASLHDRLASLGGRLMVEALELAACGGLRPVVQPEAGITYAHKIEKREALLDWSLSAEVLARRVRAFDPFPGTQTARGADSFKVWAAHAQAGGADAVGEVVAVNDQGVQVQTGDGVLVLTTLQRAGGKRLPVADFLRGFPLAVGDRLHSPEA
jgi:methionyl-tRNA formyltransferase